MCAQISSQKAWLNVEIKQCTCKSEKFRANNNKCKLMWSHLRNNVSSFSNWSCTKQVYKIHFLSVSVTVVIECNLIECVFIYGNAECVEQKKNQNQKRRGPIYMITINNHRNRDDCNLYDTFIAFDCVEKSIQLKKNQFGYKYWRSSSNEVHEIQTKLRIFFVRNIFIVQNLQKIEKLHIKFLRRISQSSK